MNKASKIIPWAVLLVVATVLLALDLWLKSWAAANLLGQPSRDLIPGFLGLTYTRNTGAAFGLFANFEWGRWVLTIVKIVLMAGLLWVFHRLPLERKYWLLRAPIILIFAGGIGNLYDRMAFGYVRDMLAFLFVNFPIFNLADVYVTTGAFVGAFIMLFVIKDVKL
ncbi:MAG: signal peptidase II [Defluviitaleaceae bacterium]|nr:signal peptidase II [Defluviitaleaceae bacterium]